MTAYEFCLHNNELVYPVKMMGSDTLIFEGPEKQSLLSFQ